ncbi:MAG: MATE family efflux transporter [Candidatus Epulonipiscioides saccharophilum]|nr:MAG: MATE family efflux transporter [Epulopiscium sp. AS2M-Bin001]
MVNENILKLWLRFVIPSIVGVLLNTIYVMVDGIFVGQGAGEEALAAVNLAWPAVTIILGLGALLGTGATILVAKKLGENDKDSAEKIFATTIKYTFFVGLFLMLIGLLFADFITKLLGANEDTFQYTKDYFVIIYLMSIPYLFSSSLNQLVRADGNPNLSMIMVSTGAILNVILDWLLVIKFQMGTTGAALATGCGVSVSTIIGLYYFTYGKSNLKLRKNNLKFNTHVLINTCRIGAASLFMQLSVGLIILIQNNVIYKYGNTIDVAVFCVAGYIFSIYAQIAIGIVQGIQPVIAFHFGASEFKRLKKLLTITLGVSIGLGLLFLGFLGLFGEELILLYGISESVLESAYTRIFIFSLGTPAVGVVYTMSSYYQATNKTTYASIITLGRGLFLQAFFVLTLPIFFGVNGVFFGQAASDISALFLVLGLVCLDVRKKNSIINPV